MEKKLKCTRIKEKQKNPLILLYIKIVATLFCLTQAKCSHSYCLDLMLKLLMLFFKSLQSSSLFFSPIPKYSHNLSGLALMQLLLFPTLAGAFSFPVFKKFLTGLIHPYHLLLPITQLNLSSFLSSHYLPGIQLCPGKYAQALTLTIKFFCK